jgi:hypothetical protein
MDHPDQDTSQSTQPAEAENEQPSEPDEPMFPMPDLDLELREGLDEEGEDR